MQTSEKLNQKIADLKYDSSSNCKEHLKVQLIIFFSAAFLFLGFLAFYPGGDCFFNHGSGCCFIMAIFFIIYPLQSYMFSQSLFIFEMKLEKLTVEFYFLIIVYLTLIYGKDTNGKDKENIEKSEIAALCAQYDIKPDELLNNKEFLSYFEIKGNLFKIKLWDKIDIVNILKGEYKIKIPWEVTFFK